MSSPACLRRGSPQPPFWGTRVLDQIDLHTPLAYINEMMLFQVQWGFRKKRRSPDEWQRYIAGEIRPIYRALIDRCRAEGIAVQNSITKLDERTAATVRSWFAADNHPSPSHEEGRA